MSNVQLRNSKQLKALEFLQQNEGNLISLEDFASFCGWQPQTAKTHISKKMKQFLKSEGSKTFRVSSAVAEISSEKFLVMMSQVQSQPEVIDYDDREAQTPKNQSNNFEQFLICEEGTSLKLKTFENKFIEYKEGFNWSNKYLYGKSVAAFANARGGCIFFGIKDIVM